jgi:hypothetical protein
MALSRDIDPDEAHGSSSSFGPGARGQCSRSRLSMRGPGSWPRLRIPFELGAPGGGASLIPRTKPRADHGDPLPATAPTFLQEAAR